MTRLPRPILAAASLLAAAAFSPVLSGCRVTESDVHRWETTELGPIKLQAVLTHDKYSMPMRLEAATSLIRMKPRQGRRVGHDKLLEGLGGLEPEERKKVVNALVPLIVKEMDKPPPTQQGMQGEAGKPDPTVPFKDAAFGLITYEKANLVTDDEVRKQINDALVRWAVADFNTRIQITSQLYGLEQVFRHLGAEGVRALPPLIVPESLYDRLTALIAELGDAKTKEAAATKLVELAKATESQAWFDKQKPKAKEQYEKEGYKIADDKLNKLVADYQDEQTVKVYASMKKVGQRPAVRYLLDVANDKAKPIKRRQASLAALEGRLDRTSDEDAAGVMKVATAEDTPDEVRDLAFARVAELPREKVVGKLYEVIQKTDTTKPDSKTRWKIRWVAGSTLLKLSSANDVKEFLTKLPIGNAPGFGMSEPLTYGDLIGKMKPPPAKEAMAADLKGPLLAVRLTAIGYFYAHGKAADVALLQPFFEEKTPLPVTHDADAKWQCGVPKAGGKPGETENKELATLGDFVKLCVEPQMTARK